MFGYPAMYPFPMLGMGAPNMMMSGGIHNLISNIKSLNLQMAAAIVQAEKMKKLNEQQKHMQDGATTRVTKHGVADVSNPRVGYKRPNTALSQQSSYSGNYKVN